jgi:phage tail-like protein
VRGTVEDLHNPDPLIRSMPAIYQGQEFLERFLSVFDTQLAPLLLALESQQAYFSPGTTPEDFLPWLASWVALPLDENWTEQQQRRMIREAVQLLRWRGTVHGLELLLVAYLGVGAHQVTVEDSGGVRWSGAPGTAVPGENPPTVKVTVRTHRTDEIHEARLRALVADAVPAHVGIEVDIRSSRS